MRRPPASSLRSGLALLGLSLGAFAFVTFETLPIGLLEPIGADLDVRSSTVGRLVTWYAVVVVVTSIPLTLALRRAPRRVVMVGTLAILAICSVLSGLAPGYGSLSAARIVAALAQSLFWSLVVPTAAPLLGPDRQGRAVSSVLAGSSLAVVLGLPAGTWLGQQVGWRPTLVLSAGVPVVAGLLVASCLRRGSAASAAAVAGRADEVRRSRTPYLVLVAGLALVTTGSFGFFTFISPYLTQAAALSAASVGVVLLVRGALGVGGVWAGGVLVDRRPRLAVLLPVVVQGVALLGLYAVTDAAVVVVAMVGLTGLAFGMVTTAAASEVLRVAPGDPDLASSGASTAVNVGIAAGALVGGLALDSAGPAAPALAAALLTLLGGVVLTIRPPPPPSTAMPH